MEKKKILLLGAGLVTEPLVKYLLAIPDFQLTIASRTVGKAEALIDDHPRGTAKSLNVQDEKMLEEAIASHDLSISLLPAQMHPTVAKFCLKHEKHLVTTSYVSSAMKEFDVPAEEKGLLFLNELGLDPGIDHMSAMRIIHDVARKSGNIVSFKSYCGGLPAPEANTNPFGYKFSWAPRGVLLASTNDARYLWEGKLHEISGKALFDDVHPLSVGGMDFEAYPNRDSMPYQSLYGLEHVHTMFRGTLRNPGWCETLKALGKVGYLDLTERVIKAQTYGSFFMELIDAQHNDFRKKLSQLTGLPESHDVFDRFDWLGLFSNDPLPKQARNPLDILVHKCLEKLQYKEGERDMIVLFHKFGVLLNGDEKTITSTLIDYGKPYGQTAMARTVSLPAAIGVKLVLQNKIRMTGVKIPIYPEIYNPILDELSELDIHCKEKMLP